MMDINKSIGQSELSIFNFFRTKGYIIAAESAKRKKARVNGWIWSRDHLKMGGDAPQIILMKIKEITASCFWDRDMFVDFTI